jgi:hypothetical protein
MWPTWADLFSIEFDEYENWGQVGLGNRAIAERIAECHTRNKITENDTVIVQWSTHLRHDWHNDKGPAGRRSGWQTNGNVFRGLNQQLYQQPWLDVFFCEKSWFMHTLNHIVLTKHFLNSLGCTYKMTSLGDLRNLGNDFDQLTYNYEKVISSTNQHITEYEAWNRFSELKIYQDKIWDDNWIKPLNLSAQENKDSYWWFQASHDKEPWMESHPSPLQHQIWLNTQLRPALDLDRAPIGQQSIIDVCTMLKEKKEFLDVLKFEEFMMNPNMDKCIFNNLAWPPIMKGF